MRLCLMQKFTYTATLCIHQILVCASSRSYMSKKIREILREIFIRTSVQWNKLMGEKYLLKKYS